MKKEQILKLNDIKARNVLTLLGLLLQHDSLSRIELAHKMNCDNTTVTRAVRDLMGRGLLIPGGKTELRHGRPREQLMLNPDGKYVIGIALDPNGIIGTVTDLRGRVKVREQAFFQMRRTRSLFLETLEKITGRLIRFADDRLAGVGVSTFGAGTDSGTGLNDIANFPELNNLNLREFFTAKFQIEPEFSDMMTCRMYDELIRYPESRHGNTLMVSAGSGLPAHLPQTSVCWHAPEAPEKACFSRRIPELRGSVFFVCVSGKIRKEYKPPWKIGNEKYKFKSNRIRPKLHK